MKWQRWLERARPPRAQLEVGELRLAPGVPFALDAGGFDRHTFLCGQSGSGKTYSLGVMLEQILHETSLRIVVLDPNSDFVRLGRTARRSRRRTSSSGIRERAGVVVRHAGERGNERFASALRAISTRAFRRPFSASIRSPIAASTRSSSRYSRRGATPAQARLAR